MPAIDSGRRAFQFTAELSFPRLVGSPGERRARELITRKWKSLGLEVEAEEFEASDFAINTAARWALVPGAVFQLLAALAFRSGHPGAALISAGLALALTFLLAAEFKTAFARWSPRGRRFKTANLIGRRAVVKSAPTVIFLAHYDSKSQTFPLWLRLSCFLAGGFGGLLLSAAIAVLAGLALLGHQLGGQAEVVWAGLGLGAISASLLLNRVGNQSPGALDNAAGVAVITEIARRLLLDPPANLNLVFVATAAEELGLCGAKAFIEKNCRDGFATRPYDPSSTYFINYDSPGYGGTVLALSAYGIPRRKISPALNRRLRDLARAKAIPLRFVYLPVGAATDLFPVLQAGFQGVNLSTLNPRIHTPADTIETIREQGLADQITLGLELARRLLERPRGS